MKIYNKLFLSFFILFFIIILFFNSNCFAFTVTDKDKNKTYNLGDIELYNYNIVYYYRNSDGSLPYIVIRSFDNEPYFKTGQFYEYLYYIGNSKQIMFYTDTLEPFKNGIDPVTGEKTNVINSNREELTNDSLRTSMLDVVFYSNFDIKDQYKNVVFQRPVLTLGEVLENNNPVMTFQIMTRGIIPYLIVFLVGLVAFWKAWQLLLKELRKA